MTAECCQPSPLPPERRLNATILTIRGPLGSPTGYQCAESINGGGNLPTVAGRTILVLPIAPPAMVRLSRTTHQDRHRVKSCVGLVKLRGPRAGRLASRVACRLMIVLRRCLGSRRPYGPQRTVQFLACTSPHPRNYAPAGAGRPLAEAREAAAGWLVALLARGCAGRRRRGAPQPARSARSVLCPRPAPNHPTARP
jgi:hypothetical protein